MVAIAPLLSVHESSLVIMDLVRKLETDFNYIFPRRSNANVSPQSTKVEPTNIVIFHL